MSSEQQRLIRMINDIAKNVTAGRDTEAASDAVYSHVMKFWPPKMQQDLIARIANSDEELHPVAEAAVAKLKG